MSTSFPEVNKDYMSLCLSQGGTVEDRTYIDKKGPLYYDWSFYGYHENQMINTNQVMFCEPVEMHSSPFSNDTRFGNDGFVSLSDITCRVAVSDDGDKHRFVFRVRVYAFSDIDHKTLLMTKDFFYYGSGDNTFTLDGIEDYPILSGQNVMFMFSSHNNTDVAGDWMFSFLFNCRLKYKQL